MADKIASCRFESVQPIVRVSRRKTIPASEVGVTLTISDKARVELDRIQEETNKAAQEGRKFYWR